LQATAEEVSASWSQVVSFDQDSDFPTKTSDAYTPIGKNLGIDGGAPSRPAGTMKRAKL